MSMIDDIKRDREAGTENADAVWGHHRFDRFTIHQCYADQKRRARVPEMEAALIAAEELADAAECIRHWHDAMADGSGMVVSSEHVHKLREKVTAYRAATGAA